MVDVHPQAQIAHDCPSIGAILFGRARAKRPRKARLASGRRKIYNRDSRIPGSPSLPSLGSLSFMVSRFSDRLKSEGLELRRGKPQVVQLNLGRLCNLTCFHCHVNAGPTRSEAMTRETMDRIVDWIAKSDIRTIDLT